VFIVGDWSVFGIVSKGYGELNDFLEFSRYILTRNPYIAVICTFVL
jgi:hypothetical protein